MQVHARYLRYIAVYITTIRFRGRILSYQRSNIDFPDIGRRDAEVAKEAGVSFEATVTGEYVAHSSEVEVKSVDVSRSRRVAAVMCCPH